MLVRTLSAPSARRGLVALLASISCSICLSFASVAGAEPAPEPSSDADISTQVDAPTPLSDAQLIAQILRINDLLERWANQIEHPQGRGPGLDDLDRLDRRVWALYGDLDGATDEDAMRRKLDALHHRTGMLRVVVQGPSDTADKSWQPPALHSTVAVFGDTLPLEAAPSVASKRGESACGQASVLDPGAWSVPDLGSGGERWLRIQVPDSVQEPARETSATTDPAAAPERMAYAVQLDTTGSRGDTALDVFAGCPAALGGPENHPLFTADDGDSLRASAALLARAGDELWVRLRSMGEGAVVLSLALAEKGVGSASISGRVTERTTGEPIGGTYVQLLNKLGGYIRATPSASDGTYSFSGIPDGTYYVRTNAYSHLNSIYESQAACMDKCEIALGTPITVTASGDLVGIDLSLSRGGNITGWNKEAATGLAVDGTLILHRLEGETARSVEGGSPDASGRYQFTRLAPGTYYVHSDTPEMFREIWDDYRCDDYCTDPTLGTAIQIVGEETHDHIDFELVEQPGIRGTVLDSQSGSPTSSGDVVVYDADGFLVRRAYTFDALGRYWVGVGEAGTYFVRAASYDHDPKLWDARDCWDCDPTTGDPVVVGDSGAVDGIDFLLDPHAVVEGTVTEAGSGDPVETALVSIFDALGNFIGSASTFDAGAWEVSGVPAGNVFARATSSTHQGGIFDGIACPDPDTCDATTGTPIPVVKTQTTSGIDFSLPRYGSIEGTLTADGSGDPLVGALVRIHDSAGDQVDSTVYTNQAGVFKKSFLLPGTYYVWAGGFEVTDEVYDGVECEGPFGPSCDVRTGTPVVVPLEATVQVDYSLQKKGWIEGTLREAGSGDVVRGQVRVYSSTGGYVESGYSDPAGFYEIRGLDAGTYFVTTDGGSRHFGQLHDGMDCDGCDPTTGTPVTVVDNSATTIDFELHPGASISGTVRLDSDPGSAIVRLYDVSGAEIDFDYSHVDGSWEFEGLHSQDVFVGAFATYHQGEVWQDLPCFPDCDPTSGTPVTLTEGTTVGGVDFDLDVLSALRVRPKDSVTGESVGARLQVHDAAGGLLQSSYTSDLQTFFVPPGTYYLTAINSTDHLDVVYGAGVCGATCDPLSGTPIVVSSFSQSIDVDILLPLGPGIHGRVTRSGVPLPGVAIDIWRTDPGPSFVTVASDVDGRFRLPLDPGTHYAATDNNLGLINEVWDGVSCPDGSVYDGLCDMTLGTPIEIVEDQPLVEIDFDLQPPKIGLIFSDGFESGDASNWQQVP